MSMEQTFFEDYVMSTEHTFIWGLRHEHGTNITETEIYAFRMLDVFNITVWGGNNDRDWKERAQNWRFSHMGLQYTGKGGGVEKFNAWVKDKQVSFKLMQYIKKK